MTDRENTAAKRRKFFRTAGLGYQLHALSDLLNGIGGQLYTDEFGLDVRSVRVLRLIDERSGITFGELHQIAHLERSLVSRILRRLVDEGYVTRGVSTQDARKHELSLTPRGQAVRKRANALSGAMHEVVTRHLTQDQVATFRATLEALLDWADSEAFAARMAALAHAPLDTPEGEAAPTPRDAAPGTADTPARSNPA